MSGRALDKYAKSGSCKPIEYHSDYRKDKDPQYYLKHSDYKFLPLSKLQKTRINSALNNSTDPIEYLSPKQLNWLKVFHSQKEHLDPKMYDAPFDQAWSEMMSSNLLSQ